MDKKIGIALLAVTLLLISPTLALSQDPPLINAYYLLNPVSLDGGMTTSKEWSDTEPLDAKLHRPSGVELPVTIWAKVDDVWLYLLVHVDVSPIMITEPYEADRLGITILDLGGDPWKPDDRDDDSGLRYDGNVWDNYCLGTSKDWEKDEADGGTIDVQGAASWDSGYWFELRKNMKGDPSHDWNATLLDPLHLRKISLYFYDGLEEKQYNEEFQLFLSIAAFVPEEQTQVDYKVRIDNVTYVFSIDCNSTIHKKYGISNMNYTSNRNVFNFTSISRGGSLVSFNVTIPKALVTKSSEIKVDIYQTPCIPVGSISSRIYDSSPPLIITENSTCYFVYFNHHYGPGCYGVSVIEASISLTHVPDYTLYIIASCVISAVASGAIIFYRKKMKSST